MGDHFPSCPTICVGLVMMGMGLITTCNASLLSIECLEKSRQLTTVLDCFAENHVFEGPICANNSSFLDV